MLATIDGVSFIARAAVDSVKNLIDAKNLIEKAFRYQMECKGFSMVEILSPCPTDWWMSSEKAVDWMRDKMINVYRLGVLKDKWKTE
jgi:2-oxoglutarate ferredoxin oxidoreductase subunit beta